MTTTFQQLADEVMLSMYGYTAKQDRTTHLDATLAANATTISFDSVSNIGKGIIEIDEELIWLDTYDRISSNGYVPPYGRGFQGTTAVEHAAGTKVTIAPNFPRFNVKKAINDTILATYPNLWGVGSTTFTTTATRTTYSLPANAETVLFVSWQLTGPSQEWRRVKSYRHDPFANSTSFATGNTISIYDGITPGRTVQVFYTKKPSTLVNNNDEFETVTGYPDSCKDVIIYGTCYRLLSFIDPGRLNYVSAEADLADSKTQYGSAASSAKYIRSLYQERLTEEAGKLRDTYPNSIHYTRY